MPTPVSTSFNPYNSSTNNTYANTGASSTSTAGNGANAGTGATAPSASTATGAADSYTNAASGATTGANTSTATSTGPAANNAFSVMMNERIGGIDMYNDTSNIGDFDNTFANLPTTGRADREPWSGSYWPVNRGGMSYRFQTGESHTYESPSMDAVKSMSLDELNKLSPTEKYDLFVGSTEYPLTSFMKSGNRKDTPSWQGYCHGWSAASIAFKEPKPVVLEGANGLKIPFSSSDIKALLTYFQGEIVRTQFGPETHPFKREVSIIGGNNNGNNPHFDTAWDLNPGSFHILLGNLVGSGKAFSIDCDNGSEKWNQPVHSYDTEIISRRPPDARASEDAVEEIVVRSTVTYTIEIEPNAEDNATSGLQTNRTEDYLYTVELDANGQIVGGQWLTEVAGTMLSYHDAKAYLEGEGLGKDDIAAALRQFFRFPDYAYFQEKGEFADTFRPAYGKYEFISGDKRKLHGYFAKLSEIYEQSTAQA